jgi:hypothetical protein
MSRREPIGSRPVTAPVEGGRRPRPPRLSVAQALAVGSLLCLATVAWAGTALAHGGTARVLVSPDRVSPGGVVDVNGEDLGSDSTVSLSIINSVGAELELIRVDADPEGHIRAALAIPVDLPAGNYRVAAVVDGQSAASAALVVEGSPIGPGGEPGAKDEDDLLLIALPSDWQRSLSGPIVTARPLTETRPAGSASRSPAWAVVGLLVVSGVAGLAGIAAARRVRSSRRPSTTADRGSRPL